jgi:hypothetical protein
MALFAYLAVIGQQNGLDKFIDSFLDLLKQQLFLTAL